MSKFQTEIDMLIQENTDKQAPNLDIGYETDEKENETPPTIVESTKSSRDSLSWSTIDEPANPRLTRKRLFATGSEPNQAKNGPWKGAEEHCDRNSSKIFIAAITEIIKNFDKLALDVQIKVRLDNKTEGEL